MAEISSAISQMIILLIITVVGYVATKLNYLDEHVKTKLSSLILNVTLPCMIVASAGELDASQLGTRVVVIFVLGIVQFFLLLGVAFLFNVLFRVSKEQRSIYYFMSVCTNTSFVGIPVAQALYGDESVLLCSIFIVAMSVLVGSIGIMILVSGQRYDGQVSTAHASAQSSVGVRHASQDNASQEDVISWNKIIKSVLNPMTAGAAIALVLVFSGASLPSVVQDSLEIIGSITAPLAMMIVGVIVAHTRIRDVVCEWRLYPYIVIRQLIAPAVLYLMLRMVLDDPGSILLGIFVVMFAMPVGSMVSMFCAAYNRDAILSAKGTVLSTLCSFAIIPLLVTFMLVV